MTDYSAATPLGRAKKFTPEVIEQIKNLVDRGKSRDEIAELVGVTTGSLQVTCSRLGVSLRRPVHENGIRRATVNRVMVRTVPQSNDKPRAMDGGGSGHSVGNGETFSAALILRYRGREQAVELPITQQMMTQLVFEAGLRDMRVGVLIGEIIEGALRQDLVAQVIKK